MLKCRGRNEMDSMVRRQNATELEIVETLSDVTKPGPDVREFSGAKRKGERWDENATWSLNQNVAQTPSKRSVKTSILLQSSTNAGEEELTRHFARMAELKDYSGTVFNLLLPAITGPAYRDLRKTASIDLLGRKELTGDDVVSFGCRVATVGTRQLLPPHPGHRRSMQSTGPNAKLGICSMFGAQTSISRLSS